MCGISGIISRSANQPARSSLEKMILAGRHRGPDGEGVFEAPGVLLGHNRLAILDLSPDGHQPMSTDDSRYTITYNGEVYNYLEIRKELEQRGHRFRSSGDTEVLLRAYQEWGEAALPRLNGMWGFVIYDRTRNVLFGARDRFGVKPFHYRLDSSHFVFASEIKQIVAAFGADGVEEQPVADFLFASLLDHNETSFFKGIKRLLPGHCFTYEIASGDLRIRKWYELRPNERASVDSGELLELLKSSVALRLRSDVKVGTCLSGGLDSSTIAALASPTYKTQSGQKFFSITASSADPGNDETPWAQKVVETCDLDGQFVKPAPDEFIASIPDVIRTQEEPFGSLSIFMQSFVMKKTQELGVKVLLDGQGGDEIFLGYPKYYQAVLFDELRSRGLGAFFRLWSDIRKHSESVTPLSVFRFFGKDAMTRWGAIGPHEMRRFASASWAKRSDQRILEYRAALSSTKAIQLSDIQTTNLPQLLRYEDRNSMRHSIETRLPFLDYRVVEFGLGLSAQDKMRDGWSKAPLRKMMQGRLPEELLWRKDKVGFAAPDRLWAREFDRLWSTHVTPNAWLRELVPSCGAARPPEDMSRINQWKLINLAIWHQIYFDEKRP